MTLKNDGKFEEEMTCRFKIEINEFNNFWLKYSKVTKIWTLVSWFWPTYIMFGFAKYREATFDGTEEWCKISRETDLRFQKWNEERWKLLPEHSKVLKLAL